jgi:hypothetical protein
VVQNTRGIEVDGSQAQVSVFLLRTFLVELCRLRNVLQSLEKLHAFNYPKNMPRRPTICRRATSEKKSCVHRRYAFEHRQPQYFNNLRLAFGLHMDPARFRRLLRQLFAVAGLSIIETISFGP